MRIVNGGTSCKILSNCFNYHIEICTTYCVAYYYVFECKPCGMCVNNEFLIRCMRLWPSRQKCRRIVWQKSGELVWNSKLFSCELLLSNPHNFLTVSNNHCKVCPFFPIGKKGFIEKVPYSERFLFAIFSKLFCDISAHREVKN